MIYDIQKELKHAEDWELSQTDETMDVEEIAEMASRAISYCEGSCPSRDLVGEHRCYCVRARFPSPEHYELYQASREEFKKMLGIMIINTALPTK